MEPYLVPEIRAHDGDVVFGKTAYQFMLKVIARSCNCIPVTFLVRAAALLDRFLEPIIKIFVLAAFGNLSLIIELHFVDKQARKTLGFLVSFLIVERKTCYGRSFLFRRCCFDYRRQFFHRDHFRDG